MVMWLVEAWRKAAVASRRRRFEQTFPGFVQRYTTGPNERNIQIILTAWDNYIQQRAPTFAPQRPLDKGYENIHVYCHQK